MFFFVPDKDELFFAELCATNMTGQKRIINNISRLNIMTLRFYLLEIVITNYFFSTLVGVSFPLTIVLLLMAIAFIISAILFMSNVEISSLCL